jgi:hypothetical protein
MVDDGLKDRFYNHSTTLRFIPDGSAKLFPKFLRRIPNLRPLRMIRLDKDVVSKHYIHIDRLFTYQLEGWYRGMTRPDVELEGVIRDRLPRRYVVDYLTIYNASRLDINGTITRYISLYLEGCLKRHSPRQGRENRTH